MVDAVDISHLGRRRRRGKKRENRSSFVFNDNVGGGERGRGEGEGGLSNILMSKASVRGHLPCQSQHVDKEYF